MTYLLPTVKALCDANLDGEFSSIRNALVQLDGGGAGTRSVFVERTVGHLVEAKIIIGQK